MWVFRDRQNDFVELEDFKLLGRLFHNLGIGYGLNTLRWYLR